MTEVNGRKSGGWVETKSLLYYLSFITNWSHGSESKSSPLMICADWEESKESKCEFSRPFQFYWASAPTIACMLGNMRSPASKMKFLEAKIKQQVLIQEGKKRPRYKLEKQNSRGQVKSQGMLVWPDAEKGQGRRRQPTALVSPKPHLKLPWSSAAQWISSQGPLHIPILQHQNFATGVS